MTELLHHLGWRLPHHLQGFIHSWLAGFLPSTVSSFSGKESRNCFVVRFFREIPASSPAFKLSSLPLDSESSDVLFCAFWFSRPQPASKTFMSKFENFGVDCFIATPNFISLGISSTGLNLSLESFPPDAHFACRKFLVILGIRWQRTKISRSSQILWTLWIFWKADILSGSLAVIFSRRR